MGRRAEGLDQEARFLTVSQPYDADSIGPMLTRLRQALGYSRTQLAQLLCARSGQSTVTRNEVARWERQDRIPTAYWRHWLAEVLAVPVDVLDTAAAIARGRDNTPGVHRTGYDQPGSLSWLTLHHGPYELLVALGAVEVDRLRTVLAPVTPPDQTSTHPTGPTDSMEASA